MNEDIPESLAEFVARGALPESVGSFLSAAVKSGRSIVVVSGTQGAGKTTPARAIGGSA